ncbi:c-type cytochrome [Roseiconus nitratireducens]|uniref:C-type cytochrome n=1 Tax=Roseiconus nitratireducens TaxID=2605748 RepID=A0A5M6DAQ2_9BACT|nr:PVC-type heme-binding CxxCH protein [Roseiconus nitratireducens]KAA5544638.1 c-type cytochrome [Roseiconus nitratireducens]
MSNFRLSFLFRLLLVGVLSSPPIAVTACAQSPADPSPADPEPVLDPGRGGRVPLKYERWSGAINVPDPVAISVADNGDVYVTQTQRRKIQDLDIRMHKDWIPDDVGLNSVEAKREFLHRVLAVGGDQERQAEHVQDVNQDGQHDWRDLTVISERIHRLVDQDADGRADAINLFAEGFQSEVTGIAAGVMHWDGSVWATIAPDVWKLTDTDGDGVADERQVMATGFGLHIAYAGHDMHGLTVGPDGKVYWSIGDKGIHVTADDGRVFDFPNQGGVLRCNPDGSDFEVFAHGLRNVQEVAFDQYGNLFGVDNDADQPKEQERFVWIVDAMDAGWRCNYQYRGDQYNPWTDEKLWELAGEDHPAYLIPPIRHYYDGPAGFKFNPGAALSSAYRDYFFLTGAPNGSQYAFRTQVDGDSFQMVDSHVIGSGDPIVGIAFGPDGGLYGVDWGGGYPLNQSGSVIRIDVPPSALSEQDRNDRESALALLSSGLDTLTAEDLVRLLANVDQRVRLRAQFALVRRERGDLLQAVAADPEALQLARLHAIWGLGQLSRSGGVDPSGLNDYLNDPDWIIRAQTAKTLGEINESDPEVLIPLLHDEHPHVRIHAALALGRQPSGNATEVLLRQSDSLEEHQHYLRHALVTGLAACSDAQTLADQAESHSESRRLCATLALRRQESPLIAAFLDDPSDHIATEAARAIHDDRSIPQAMGALASTLNATQSRPTPMVLRSINANFRLGSSARAAAVMAFAADAGRSIAMRRNACQALGQWMDPPLLDRVDGRRRAYEPGREIDRDACATLLARLVTDSDTPLRIAAVQASRQLKIDLSSEALGAMATDRSLPDDLRMEAMQTLAEAGSGAAELLQELAEDPSPAIASRAIGLLVQVSPERAGAVIEQQLKAKSLAVRQACVSGLAELGTAKADAAINDLAKDFLTGKLPNGLRLDVWQALQSRAAENPMVEDRWNAVQQLPELQTVESANLIPFHFARDGGDAGRGEQMFRTDVRAQCVRCHRVGKEGSEIGPELTKIARQRDADHLLRAIVLPSADIEPKYNTQTLLLADGSVAQGVIVSETDESTMLLTQDGTEIQIPTDQIEEVAERKVSLMPTMTDVLSAQEVRDLVAYLKTLR